MFMIRNVFRLVLLVCFSLTFIWSEPLNALILDTIAPYLPFDLSQYPKEAASTEWVVIALSLIFAIGCITGLEVNHSDDKPKKKNIGGYQPEAPSPESKPMAPPPPPKLRDEYYP